MARRNAVAAAVTIAVFAQVGCVALAEQEGTYVVLNPDGYYDDVVTGDANALRESLHEIIRDHQRHSYKGTWAILERADQALDDETHILDVYRNQRFTKLTVNRPYNREHTWPKSYGFPQDGSENSAFTDCHALFLSFDSYNFSRSNKPYGECDETCDSRPTIDGQANRTRSGVWETWPGRRGDVARALLYMDVRYEGGINSQSGTAEPNLVLTDDMSLVTTTGGVNASLGYMGSRSVLLRWHRDDPVDDIERTRNQVVYEEQGNRNPFIDHPSWAGCVFEGICGTDTDPVDPDSIDPEGPEEPPVGGLAITEIHYDNAGADQDEFVEVSAPPGTDLTGWVLWGYNGNGGVPYRSVGLSGAVSSNGHVRVDFPQMQNGAPDGLALVSPDGGIIEALSYEGDFVGNEGPGAGIHFEGIGVAENASTALGHSLQRVGSAWFGPLPASPGEAN